MQPKPPNLEIVVPTYNRAAQLRLRMEELVCQLSENEQVTIFDNGSTDDTDQICAAYAMDKKVKVVRYPHNWGLSRNVMRCFEESSGEFVWILSDDDPIRPDALETLRVKIVSCGNSKLLVFKAQGNSVRHDRVFTSACDFLAVQSITDLSYISSLVFHRTSIQPFLGLLAPASYSILPHVLVYLSAVAESRPLQTFTEQLLIDQRGETRVSRKEFLLGAATLPTFFADLQTRQRVARQVRSATRWMLFSALAQTSSAQDRKDWKRVIRIADHTLACCGATLFGSLLPHSLHSLKDKARELLKLSIWFLPEAALSRAAKMLSRRTHQDPDKVTCDARIQQS